jgi:tRNA-specific 2-thiouridylase
MAANTVTVGPERALYTREILVEDLNWIAVEGLSGPMRVKAKTRSRQGEQEAELFPETGGRVRIVFDRPQRAVTPGQAAVFYDGDSVVGGGTIVEIGKEDGHEL